MPTKTIKKLSTLLEQGLIQAADLPALQQVVDRFDLSITDTMHALIDNNNDQDPIKRQFVPSMQELIIQEQELDDPIGDSAHEAVKGIIHRYPDRCLFMPVQVCAVYCRFCFRREQVGGAQNTLTKDEQNTAFHYIESHPEIWEVILTGGDPLILKPSILQTILQRLNAISHVEVIRIHTRIPVVDPARITKDLQNAFSIDKALYVAIHANHANEFSPAAVAAIKKLVNVGIPLISQTTLLKGINDDIHSLTDLMRTFVKNKIKPYYLHHADLAKGTSHFRTTIQEGQALVRQLRGRVSGLCQPIYVLDIPGGFGKVPIGPHYIHADDHQCCIEDYEGVMHAYE